MVSPDININAFPIRKIIMKKRILSELRKVLAIAQGQKRGQVARTIEYAADPGLKQVIGQHIIHRNPLTRLEAHHAVLDGPTDLESMNVTLLKNLASKTLIRGNTRSYRVTASSSAASSAGVIARAAAFSARSALNARYTNEPMNHPSMYWNGVSPVV